MSVIRDYIPEGEELTPAERDWKDRRSGVKPDFIPPEGWKCAPRPDPDEQARLAMEAVQRRAGQGWKDHFERAKKRLPATSVAAAIAYIEGLPMLVREVWLVAEEEGLARKTLLQRFPKPSQEMRKRLLEE